MQSYKSEDVEIVEPNTLILGDCLEVMSKIADKSIDMILTDLPYELTSCNWDIQIPFDKLWEQYERIIKDDAAIVLFGNEPFSSNLRLSNPKLYKYDWKWIKSRALNFQNSKNAPMKKYEDVIVFSKGTTANRSPRLMKYYPQGLKPYNKIVNGIKASASDSEGHKYTRASHKASRLQEFTNYPNNILEFKSEPKPVHPTQKPVDLLEYLVKTYTLENEVVLDCTMGSGSVGVACQNCGRKFIGIELSEKYFEISKERIG